MKQTEKTLKALANRRRLGIIKYLSKTDKATVGELASEIKLSLKATSKHLLILRSADIVDREQVSLSVFYFLTRPISNLTKSILTLL
jgi:DNA-binding transcriptional ArsR family regulator